jgi:hypothetical protein
MISNTLENRPLHLFSFKTPILLGKKIRKNVKSKVGKYKHRWEAK